MSDKNQPWTIRGIHPETRNAVRLAARKSGKGIGEWVEDVLIQAATNQIKAPQTPAIPLEQTLSRIMDRLEHLEKAPEKPVEQRKGFLGFLLPRK